MSDVAGEVGRPSRVSREGVRRRTEPGKGKHSPPANPERLTLGAPERVVRRRSFNEIKNGNIINTL